VKLTNLTITPKLGILVGVTLFGLCIAGALAGYLMQQEMLAAQESLKNEVVEGSAGGGMVKVEVTGDLHVRSITIDPAAVDPDDAEMLSDMVLAAVNEALDRSRELATDELGQLTAGIGLPPGLI